jgi:hypothetical protein
MTETPDPLLLAFWAVMSHLCCDDCLDEHLENPQSVSCYCSCHNSRLDEARWAEMKDHIKSIWPTADERCIFAGLKS